MTEARFPNGAYPPGLVAITCTEVMWSQCAAQLFAMLLNAPVSAHICLDSCQAPTIQKRNYLVEQVLESKDLRWLLFVDADTLPPKDTVQRLLQAGADPGRHVVGALCFTRHHMPYRPAAGFFNGNDVTYLNQFDGKAHRVDWVGTACVLIWREVLERAAARRGLEVFKPKPGYAKFGRGEDEEFSHFVGTLGFHLYCDTPISVGHLGLTNIDLVLVNRLASSQAPRDDANCQVWLRGMPPNPGIGAVGRSRGPAPA